jgi:phenazine biosynthesis protein phzE
MFAPTVTGSPIRNACRVIARHERRGRRYYGGVLALIGRDGSVGSGGSDTLDAPILIRTAEITADGVVRVAAGATLVRGSRPADELAETRAKARGILSALRPVPEAARAVSGPGGQDAPDHGGAVVERVLAERNATLSRFWLEPQLPEPAPATGPLVTVIDAEDDFTAMFAHLLRALGRRVDVRPWTDLETDRGPEGLADRPTLVVLGPGPGDPRDSSDPRMHALHTLAKTRLANGGPMLGICLGHQVIAHTLGLRVRRLTVPDQGRQRAVDLFGRPERVGFYNSYVAEAPPVPMPGFTFSTGDDGRRLHAVRGPGLTGLQFHAESVLTTDGPGILATELARLGS